MPANAAMFDDDGNFSGSWKQMTNVPITQNPLNSRYSASSYTTSSWKNSQKQAGQRAVSSYQTDTMPYRYNTLDYKRVRKVKGGYGDYSARCTDIGDASFCR